ncbi:hypothetical protein OHQ89_09655 [Streptomyces canus]|uniref:hypothetical protein n=1 Tax=Streptomyces canus TaxID=58343 RepID=UPI0030E41EC3
MSSPHDFDFFHGDWKVVNRRRTDFLDPDSGWEEFPATSRCRPLFDGAANVDEIDMPHLGAKGATLRLFDRETEQWSLNWAASRSGKLYPPVIGQFEGGRGEFYGDDTYGGKDVRVRFVWADVSAAGARWEQAFSVDGGETWVTNWTVDFSRPSGTPGR